MIVNSDSKNVIIISPKIRFNFYIFILTKSERSKERRGALKWIDSPFDLGRARIRLFEDLFSFYYPYRIKTFNNF